MNDKNDSLKLLDNLLSKAAAVGADAADAVFVESVSLSYTQRLGEREHLARAESADLGLRVFIGSRQAIVSSSDTSAEALGELVDRAVAMAQSVPEDPFCGLADSDQLANDFPDLEVCDEREPTETTLAERAKQAEDNAREIPGVTNSEGAEASWGRSQMTIASSNGFAKSRSDSRHSISVSVMAGENPAMERDYDFASAVYGEDLPSPAEIGRSAGEKAVARLNPKKVDSAEMPVVYDPRVANSLLRHLASAINGNAVARGTTFLKDKLREKIFSDAITIVDDPLRRRGLRSRSFDGEGIGTERRNVIDGGVLTTWIMDLRSARQLGLATTGHARRGPSSPPSPATTNLYLQAGEMTPEALMADIKAGFYITELMGFGVNGITGDYSRGACGFLIENGEIAYPVNEVSIAGNLMDMYMNLTAADDLEFRYGIDSPTLRVEGMTVAGR